MNFNVPYPPHYYREIWDYKHANIENIRKAISKYDCHKAFKNKDTNEMTRILTSQETFNVDSTLIYVEITSRHRSTFIQRRFVNVDSSMNFNVETTLILGLIMMLEK